MPNILLQFDLQIAQLINSVLPHNIFFDFFFAFFSMIGSAAFIWIVIVLLLIIFEEKRNHKFIISFIISILVTAVLVNAVIKNIVQRPRPATSNIPHSQYSILYTSCPKDYSFPSGHASTAFAAATVIAFYDKKRKWVYYSVAGLISLSRIYLGCHFVLDVIGGGIIGYTTSLILNYFMIKFVYE